MKYIMLILLLSIANIVFNQGSLANYKQITNLNGVIDSNIAQLIFNGKFSKYSYGIASQMEQTNHFTSENLNERLKLRDSKGFIYHGDYAKGIFTNREYLLTKPVIVIDEIPNIKWNVNFNESKIIIGMRAYKAIGDFRGRTYTAWYTLEIPEKYGPWKLTGLPGLILEAYDQENIIHFEVMDIHDSYLTFEKPIERINLSQKQYVKKFKKKLEQLTKFMSVNSGVSKTFKVNSKSRLHVIERSLFED